MFVSLISALFLTLWVVMLQFPSGNFSEQVLAGHSCQTESVFLVDFHFAPGGLPPRLILRDLVGLDSAEIG